METYQSIFHQQWSHLKDPHVRSLAWLLFSPDLLDEHAAIWHHQIKSFHFSSEKQNQLVQWLNALDEAPTALHEAVSAHQFLRLGHYAENLLSFYFKHESLLYAHGLQVHDKQVGTVGEFDFLLFDPDGLSHLEIATKFYLFHQINNGQEDANLFDFLGPKLNDTLGSKMDKIVHQQLLLSKHEAASKLLNEKVVEAKALIKGWFFYRPQTNHTLPIHGIAANHCKGYWWTLEEFSHLTIAHALQLERLEWLAPAQVVVDEVFDKEMVIDALHRQFNLNNSPILIAIMKKNGDVMQEFCRGFVVPNDWLERANQNSHALSFR